MPILKMKAGDKIGRWTVVVPVVNKGSKNTKGLFRCDCGAEKEVQRGTVSNGKSVSCGCYASERKIARQTTHGHAPGKSKSAEYTVWDTMIQRCENPNATGYPWYGARGISVCARWRRSFRDFLTDMGPRPPGLEIDRIDNDGNYEPGNCRWVTHHQQMQNTRRSGGSNNRPDGSGT